jgi:hypothetical protein
MTPFLWILTGVALSWFIQGIVLFFWAGWMSTPMTPPKRKPWWKGWWSR